MTIDPSVIVLATKNANKIKEMTAIFSDTNLKFKTAAELGCPDVVEDGDTLEVNARKKAYEVARFTNHIALADDSGLEVDFLDGAPGVISARWAGANCSYTDNCNKLLKSLKGVPHQHRKAKFRSVIALAVPGGATQTVEGAISGFITESMKGADGFGYDPVFWVPEFNKTLAEMTAAQKNQMSHRYKALQAIRPVLINLQRNIAGHKPASKKPPFEII